jgi:hypothetical protein
MTIEKNGRRLSLLIAGAAFSAVAITAVYAQSAEALDRPCERPGAAAESFGGPM